MKEVQLKMYLQLTTIFKSP